MKVKCINTIKLNGDSKDQERRSDREKSKTANNPSSNQKRKLSESSFRKINVIKEVFK